MPDRPKASGRLRITEVLPEPPHELWVSTDDGKSRLLRLSTLLQDVRYATLHNPAVFVRGQLTNEGFDWPCGTLITTSRLLAPGPEIEVVAVVPFEQRFRPLFGYLYRAADPPVAAYPKYVPHTEAIQRVLGFSQADLNRLLPRYPVPQEVGFARLYDLAVLLNALFPGALVRPLLRAPWPYAERHFPNQPLLHSMRGCIEQARPDLIERPLLALAYGQHFPERA